MLIDFISDLLRQLHSACCLWRMLRYNRQHPSTAQMDRFVHKQSLWIVVLLALPVFHLRDPDESDGISNFEDYYRCYFTKYFKLADPSSDMVGKRGVFVSQLLSAALLSDSLAPSRACVQWMCHLDLIWKIWSIGSTEVWAYYSKIGNTIWAWEDCFQERKTELENYEKIILGLI